MKNCIFTFIMSLLATFLLGFFLPHAWQVNTYQYFAWHFMFASFMLLIFSLYNAEPAIKLFATLRQKCKAVVLATLIVCLGFLLSGPDFRILADETNLLGVSLEMHENTRTVLPVESLYFYHGMRRPISEKTEMRPPAYPFMLSLLHNISGYRPANAFIFNAFCAWLTLILLFLFVDQREARLWGYIAMLALASYPVFVQYFTSAGFEVFNLTMLMLAFYLLDKFIETENLWSLVALVATLVIAAHSRYESILAIFCIMPVVFKFLPPDFRQSWREKLIFAFPLLLLPAFWLRAITWEASRFQVETIAEAFSIANLWPNLKGALMFFLSGRSQKFAGPILTMCAMIGFILFIEKWTNKKLTQQQRWFSVSLGSCAFVHLLVRLVYSNGNFMDSFTTRLAIVFLPLCAGLAIGGLRRIERFKSPVNIAPAILLLVVTLLISSWPVAASNNGVASLRLFRDFKYSRQALEQIKAGEESILIVRRPNMFVPFGYSALTFDSAHEMSEQLVKMLRIKSYQRLIAIQHIRYKDNEPEEALPLEFAELKSRIVFETQLSGTHRLRITEFSR